MLRGNVILDGKEFYAKRGTGQFIRGKGYARRLKQRNRPDAA